MKKLLFLLMIAGLVCASNAATIRYRNNGSWDQLATWDGAAWSGTGWQNASAPGTADTVRANWGGNTVTLNYSTTVGVFQAGVDESGTFHIQNGGVLTATGNSKIGNNNVCTGTMRIDAGGTVNANGGWLMVAGSSNVTGILTVDGGTLNIAGHLWTTTGANSSATININDGGVINVGGIIGLGSVDFAAAGGATLLNVNSGGLLALSNIHGEGISSIKNGSLIDITGTGRITLAGDFVGVINTYAANNLLAGNGVLGNVQASFADGITTVTAIPEPASLSLLGLGALALIRKRK